jgi:hypothetical protein
MLSQVPPPIKTPNVAFLLFIQVLFINHIMGWYPTLHNPRKYANPFGGPLPTQRPQPTWLSHTNLNNNVVIVQKYIFHVFLSLLVMKAVLLLI